jgi:phosphatidylglycerophosphatase C
MAQDQNGPAIHSKSPEGGAHGPREIAAFDFDGTLTVRDSFTAFLAWRAGPVGYALGFVRLIPAALAYLVHRDRGRIKAAALKAYLKGLTRDELADAAHRFADAHAPRLFRPDALKTWAEWREKGALRVIVTASPEDVVAPFARILGADELLGTQIHYDEAGRVVGTFSSANCRGSEKVARLETRFGPGVRLKAAYGDTSGDHEMLAIAEIQGYRQFTGRPDLS